MHNSSGKDTGSHRTEHWLRRTGTVALTHRTPGSGGAEYSASQEELIQQILKDFPETSDSHEYRDYLSSPSKGTASEFISRSIEDNFDRIGTRDNYVRYIAYRPGAERFGTHGLFTDANIPIDLNAVAEEVGNHQGILMTEVLSIRREDAVRLGFDKGEVWRDMLRSQTSAMAQAMNIPLEDLRWYAAFHDESHHPHCHILAYSVGKEPYMSQQNLMQLKESCAHEIFRQDLLTAYQEQTSQRNLLRQETFPLFLSSRTETRVIYLSEYKIFLGRIMSPQRPE